VPSAFGKGEGADNWNPSKSGLPRDALGDTPIASSTGSAATNCRSLLAIVPQAAAKNVGAFYHLPSERHEQGSNSYHP
jgi:hypothetical protein